jgi:glycine dehydrogenase subunit 1
MLQSIYEYQTLICQLTGMELANASMYDAATAIAEGALMALDITNRDTVVVARSVHPHYRRVLETYVLRSGFKIETLDHDEGVMSMGVLDKHLSDKTACVVVQQPNFFGNLEDLETFHDHIRKIGALSIVSVDPISLGLLKPPGEFGADIVVGEGQSLGCSMGFGGPLLGFFACKREYQRKFPGRIVGATTDSQGRRGFTMTLRTREQDIRREKATSNICTNEALLALCATIYLCEMGKHGLQQVADLCLQKAHYACERLSALDGVEPRFRVPFFKEFTIRLPFTTSPAAVNQALLDYGIIGGFELGKVYPELTDSMTLCVTETRTREDIDRLVSAMAQITG